MTFSGRTLTFRFQTTNGDLGYLREIVTALVNSRFRLYLPATIVIDCVPEWPAESVSDARTYDLDLT